MQNKIQNMQFGNFDWPARCAGQIKTKKCGSEKITKYHTGQAEIKKRCAVPKKFPNTLVRQIYQNA